MNTEFQGICGFIGTGSMGSMLVQTMVQSHALDSNRVMLFNRTATKAEHIAHRYHGMMVADNIQQLAEQCDLIFICVKPLEYRAVFDQIGYLLGEHQIVISITSPITIAQLESLTSAKIGKLIPSVTNSLQSGAALYTFGERLHEQDRTKLIILYKSLGLPVEVEENYTRIASDITSCGPAFMSLLIELWVQAAYARTGISPTTSRQLITEMLVGLSHLLSCGGVTPNEIITKVAVPGGITAAGLTCLAEQCDHVFHQLSELTHAKFAEDSRLVAEMLEPIRPQY